MAQRWRRSPFLTLLLVGSLTAGGCGTQLSEQELQAADRLGARGVALQEDGEGLEPGARSGSGGAQVGASGASPAARSSAPDGSATGRGSGGGGAIDAPAPAEGNGGATDVGVTGDSITLGLITTLTGPRPGLFRGAAQGAQACALRANANGGLFGRSLEVRVGDDQANENQTRTLADRFAKETFAFVGSFTLFDGAMKPALDAGVPDMGTTLQPARNEHPNNFAPQPNAPGWQTGGLRYLKQQYPEAAQAVGVLGADLAPTQNEGIKAVLRELGYTIVYDQTYGATTQDFTPYVFRMRSEGVRFLIMTGDATAYARVLQAADQQSWEPEVFNPVSNAYDPNFVELAGPSAEGTIVYMTHVLYQGEDAGTVPEVDEYLTWLARVDPNATPDVFGVYGWTSCVMFLQAAKAVGPQLTRAALLEELGKITEFTGNGLIATNNPAEKVPPSCYAVVQLKGGKWQRVDTPAGGFRCDGSYLYL